ncbi:hypothetical protein [Moorena producens]|uniref:hypothetical protein n=1 Tax=Moorena producens TaxID=1155739 RepID=UPI003C72D263
MRRWGDREMGGTESCMFDRNLVSTKNETGKMPVPQNYSNRFIIKQHQKKGADCVSSPKIEVDSTYIKSG